MTTRDLTAGRAREANAITVVLALPCGLACAGSVIPGLDQAVTAALFTLGGLAVAQLVLRWVARWLRERVEDRADARTAAAWRACHAPHSAPQDLTQRSCSAQVTTTSSRVGAAARVAVDARRGWS